MAKLVTKENKLIWLVKAPIRALAKARDFYVNNMIKCAGHVSAPVAFSHVSIYELPRSSSSRSKNADDDLRELIRAASTKTLVMKGLYVSENSSGSNGVMRSQSVGIGRIDEDKMCEFGGEFEAKFDHKYSRSRSYAVPRRRIV